MSVRMVRFVVLLALLFAPLGLQQPIQAAAEPPTPTPALEPVAAPALETPGVDASLSITATLPVTETVPFAGLQEPAGAFTVNSAEDLPDAAPGNGSCAASNGKCTLRAAVMEANAKSDADTINVPAMTILLGSELSVIQPVTIKGAGQAATILDGRSATRVLRFAARSGTHSVSDLTIQNAVNNSTDQVERYGGGIFSQASLHVTNVTVKNCKAFEGGGIYNRYYFPGDEPSGPHTLWLTNVSLLNNQATATVSYFGAGGLFNGSNLYADGLKISGNSAPTQGGGFLNNTDPQYNLTVQIKNFEISNNTSVDGGGVDVDLGTVTFTNGKISGNTSNCCRPAPYANQATGGGGIYSNEGVITLTNVQIANNKATHPRGYGGGIYNSERMTLVNVSLTGNSAALGAAIHNGNYLGKANQLSLTNVTISGNTATLLPGGTTAEGGAIFNVQAGVVAVVNSTITQNSAQFTGGITNYDRAGAVSLINTILAGNSDEGKAPDCSGTITSLGNNLLGDTDGSRAKTCSLALKAGDKANVTNAVTPLLLSHTVLNSTALGIQAALAYFPLQVGSPAINAGSNTQCPATDEIGAKRPYNQTCDIGAIEFTGSSARYKSIYFPVVRK